MHIDRGIVFAEREGFRALELDLYRKSTESPGAPSPLLVYVHGGGWRQSHRGRPPRETRPWSPGFFDRLTDAGFVVAAPSYRFSGEATFPAQLDDVLDAIRWLHEHAGDLGVDPTRTYCWGTSAGGLLAAPRRARSRRTARGRCRVLVPRHRPLGPRPTGSRLVRGAASSAARSASISTWPETPAR